VIEPFMVRPQGHLILIAMGSAFSAARIRPAVTQRPTSPPDPSSRPKSRENPCPEKFGPDAKPFSGAKCSSRLPHGDSDPGGEDLDGPRGTSILSRPGEHGPLWGSRADFIPPFESLNREIKGLIEITGREPLKSLPSGEPRPCGGVPPLIRNIPLDHTAGPRTLEGHETIAAANRAQGPMKPRKNI
jgi:hypothetical protein